MILFFDTETTGKVDFRMPPDHECQPHLVQLGCILADEDGTERAVASLVVDPDGFEIPEEAAAIHGISKDLAMHCGVPLPVVLGVFVNLRSQARRIVAYNLDFDAAVIDAAMARLGRKASHPGPSDAFCVMKAATPICKIPHANPRRPDDWKWPKLEEATRLLLNEEMTGAHDALADARACKALYFKLQENAA
jgi:DNA polymerase III subunit epsilon